VRSCQRHIYLVLSKEISIGNLVQASHSPRQHPFALNPVCSNKTARKSAHAWFPVNTGHQSLERSQGWDGSVFWMSCEASQGDPEASCPLVRWEETLQEVVLRPAKLLPCQNNGPPGWVIFVLCRSAVSMMESPVPPGLLLLELVRAQMNEAKACLPFSRGSLNLSLLQSSWITGAPPTPGSRNKHLLPRIWADPFKHTLQKHSF
jgi:hypothetical protein